MLAKATVYVSVEVSGKSWVLAIRALHNVEKIAISTIRPADVDALVARINSAAGIWEHMHGVRSRVLWGARSNTQSTIGVEQEFALHTCSVPFMTTRTITIDGVLTRVWASERLAVLLGSLGQRRAIHLRANRSSVAYAMCIIGPLNSADKIFAPYRGANSYFGPL